MHQAPEKQLAPPVEASSLTATTTPSPAFDLLPLLGLPHPPDFAQPPPPLPALWVEVTEQQASLAAPLKAGQAGLKQTNTSQSFGRRGTFRPGTCLLEKINASKLGGDLRRPKKKLDPWTFVRASQLSAQMLQYHNR